MSIAGLGSIWRDTRYTGCSGKGRVSRTKAGTGAGCAAGGCTLACLDDTVSSQRARKIVAAANRAQTVAFLCIPLTISSATSPSTCQAPPKGTLPWIQASGQDFVSRQTQPGITLREDARKAYEVTTPGSMDMPYQSLTIRTSSTGERRERQSVHPASLILEWPEQEATRTYAIEQPV